MPGIKPNRQWGAIDALLAADPISLDIVRYLVRHNNAADTPAGIAEWWIGGDITRTAEALSRLQARRIVRSQLVHGVTYVYMLTKNHRVREMLRQAVDRLTPVGVDDPQTRSDVIAHADADANAEVG